MTRTQEQWQRDHRGRKRCDVYRPVPGGTCTGVSVSWFTAECREGHVMEGAACVFCRHSPKLACGRCHEDTSRRVPVTITFTELAAAS